MIIIAGLTVGLSVYSWNAARVVGNQLPMPFGVGASVVLTGSMEPTLKANDLVFVAEQEDYKVDDIVVYQSSNQLIIHRIISIADDKVITKGDANNTSDDPITKDQIKGRYVFRIPLIGFVFKILKTVPGTICVLALVVFLMYRSRRKERDRSNQELEKLVAEIRALQEQNGSSVEPDASAESDMPAETDASAALDVSAESNASAESDMSAETDVSVESDVSAEPDSVESDVSAQAEESTASEEGAGESETMIADESSENREEAAAAFDDTPDSETAADAQSDTDASDEAVVSKDTSADDSGLSEINDILKGLDI